MAIFNPFSKPGDNLIKAAYIQCENNTGAAVVKGTVGLFSYATEKIIAASTQALINALPNLVALDNIASGAFGRWAYEGEVFANVGSGVSTTNAPLMPDIAATGGAAFVAFASDSKAANKGCALTKEAGAGTTLTRILLASNGLSTFSTTT